MNNELMNELDELMRSQIELIDRAIGKARADEIMDIGALNANIDKICARAGTLDEESAKQIEGRMAEMIGKLEDFAAELSALQERTGRE
jgi:hypothetical protein